MTSELRRHELTVPETLDGQRLDQALAAMLPDYSRTQIKRWIEQGRVTTAVPDLKPRTRVHRGDHLRLDALLEPDESLAPQAVGYDICYEDKDLLVVDKPPGVVVHPGAGNRDHTLVNGLVARFPELAVLPRAGLVHRIDKDTTGLLLVARNTGSYQALVTAMAARQIRRTYVAVVNGAVESGGRIEAAIGRDPVRRTRMRVRADGRPAVTNYEVVEPYRFHTRLAVRLETGRTHQIRVHMAWLGHPLAGDARYGGRRMPAAASPELLACLEQFDRQALHAASLTLHHPETDETITVESPLPADLERLVDTLRADHAANS